MSDMNKLRERSPAQRRILAEAVVAVALARLAVPLVPFERIARRLGLAQGESLERFESDHARRALTVAWAVRAAAERLPWHNSCLVEALAAGALLRRRGIPATLYLGVATNVPAPDLMAAHAWVRCGETIVIGRRGHERFTAVASFS